MIRSLYWSPDGDIQHDLEPGQFGTLSRQPGGLLWVDFEATPPGDDELILREQFGFHPLAIDDALQESHVPKLDDWGDYLYIVLHTVKYNQADEQDLTTLELDIFLGKNFIVTHHDQTLSAIDRVWSLIARDDRYLKNGADHLFYRLVDEVIASYMPVVDQLDEAIDRAEDEVFAHPTTELLGQIFMFKRAILHLRRIIGPQREVLNKLARDEYKVIDPHERVYFRDVYDHLVRLYDITESIRDLVSGTLDTYLSVINNRMNDIMKTLTIITTLFMPISFIASFFGMNFFQPVASLEHWTRYPAFIVTLIFVVLTPLSILIWARRRGWI